MEIGYEYLYRLLALALAFVCRIVERVILPDRYLFSTKFMQSEKHLCYKNRIIILFIITQVII